MSSSTIAPEYELFPDRYRWTVEQCYAMVAAGQLAGRYELLDGEVVNKMGQNPAHAMTLTRLMTLMTRIFGPEFVRIQTPIALDAPDNIYTEPEPDVAVTLGMPENYSSRHPRAEDLRRVAEVSDTTLRADLLVKALLYARAGIPEYWIIDLPGRQVHVHTEPIDGNYACVTVHGADAAIAVAAFPDRPLRVSDLLPPAPA